MPLCYEVSTLNRSRHIRLDASRAHEDMISVTAEWKFKYASYNWLTSIATLIGEGSRRWIFSIRWIAGSIADQNLGQFDF